MLSLVEAGGKGFEPLHTDSESAVLPLDEPPMLQCLIVKTMVFYHVFAAWQGEINKNFSRSRRFEHPTRLESGENEN